MIQGQGVPFRNTCHANVTSRSRSAGLFKCNSVLDFIYICITNILGSGRVGSGRVALRKKNKGDVPKGVSDSTLSNKKLVWEWQTWAFKTCHVATFLVKPMARRMFVSQTKVLVVPILHLQVWIDVLLTVTGSWRSAFFQSCTYLNKVLAFGDELDDSLGSNSSSIFLQNNLLQGNTTKNANKYLQKVLYRRWQCSSFLHYLRY